MTRFVFGGGAFDLVFVPPRVDGGSLAGRIGLAYTIYLDADATVLCPITDLSGNVVTDSVVRTTADSLFGAFLTVDETLTVVYGKTPGGEIVALHADIPGRLAELQNKALRRDANLADLDTPADARDNLELGSAATHAATEFDLAGAGADAAAASIPLVQKGAANGVATLDSSGKLLGAQVPPIAINDTFTVVSQAAMLALTAHRGDVAVRTDLTPAQTFMLVADDATVLSNWVQITTPAAVTTVDGQTGVVDLAGSYAPRVPEWLPDHAYFDKELATHGALLYQRNGDGTSGSSWSGTNWTLVGGAVQSVNGLTGPVLLAATDVGAVAQSERATPGGQVATIDPATGKLNTAQIPAVATTGAKIYAQDTDPGLDVGEVWLRTAPAADLLSVAPWTQAFWASKLALAEGAPVTTWPDAMGTPASCDQLAGTLAPVLRRTVPGFNSRPAVEFDAGRTDGSGNAGTALRTANANWWTASPMPSTQVIIAYAAIESAIVDGPSSTYKRLVYRSSGNHYWGIRAASSPTLYTAGIPSDALPHLFIIDWVAGASVIEIDGTVLATGDAGSAQSRGFTFGADATGALLLTGAIAWVSRIGGRLLTSSEKIAMRAAVKSYYNLLAIANTS